VILNIADRHPTGRQGDDHVIQATKAPGDLRYQAWNEGSGTVSGDIEIDVADLAGHRFGAGPVSRTRIQMRLGIALSLANMVSQLDLQTTF
jgi:hypothetical protein